MTSSAASSEFKQLFLITLGAIVGAALGTGITYFLSEQGVRAAAIPGGMLGLAAGMFRHRTLAVPIVCCFAALALGLVVEWKLFPWADDQSFIYFMKNLHEKRALILIMIGIGAAVGFYSPYRAMMPTSVK